MIQNIEENLLTSQNQQGNPENTKLTDKQKTAKIISQILALHGSNEREMLSKSLKELQKIVEVKLDEKKTPKICLKPLDILSPDVLEDKFMEESKKAIENLKKHLTNFSKNSFLLS